MLEDQTLFRELLVKLLQAEPGFELAGTASEGRSGIELLETVEADLLLLDIQLPDLDGLELADELARRHPDLRIMALTSLQDRWTVQRIMECGLAGYVEKDQPIQILTEAMRTIAEGGCYFTERFAATRRRMAADPVSFHKILSKREQQVLSEVAGGASTSDIARKLKLSERTVGNHRYNLMKKLELKNASELTAYAIKHGFRRL